MVNQNKNIVDITGLPKFNDLVILKVLNYSIDDGGNEFYMCIMDNGKTMPVPKSFFERS